MTPPRGAEDVAGMSTDPESRRPPQADRADDVVTRRAGEARTGAGAGTLGFSSCRDKSKPNNMPTR